MTVTPRRSAWSPVASGDFSNVFEKSPLPILAVNTGRVLQNVRCNDQGPGRYAAVEIRSLGGDRNGLDQRGTLASRSPAIVSTAAGADRQMSPHRALPPSWGSGSGHWPWRRDCTREMLRGGVLGVKRQGSQPCRRQEWIAEGHRCRGQAAHDESLSACRLRQPSAQCSTSAVRRSGSSVIARG